MARSLLGLPVRIGLRATGMALSLAVGVAEEALGVAGRVAEALVRRSEPEPDLDSFSAPEEPEESEQPDAAAPAGEPAPPPPPRPPRQSAPGPAGTGPAPAARPARPARAEPAVPKLQEPRHVSEEPTVVASSAEPGAEESPGPELHVEEPWPGYRQMTAPDVVDRLRVASVAELAAVRLYEQSGRRRRSILAAVERELGRR